MPKSFGDWMKDMAGTIPDASEFKRKPTGEVDKKDPRVIAYYNTLLLLGKPLGEGDVRFFIETYIDYVIGTALSRDFMSTRGDEDTLQWWYEFQKSIGVYKGDK